uniref:Uncharacterized protein n=1 Tax=Lactuca sativa TaxID=4236 RepID=A0A9R1WAV6_LACSA|nr:hypothetical protein LSAT_V11C200071590 [Lactuca sativa]
MVNRLNMLSITLSELVQVSTIIENFPPSLKDFSKRMMHKLEDYPLDTLIKHLHIEEKTCFEDKGSKVELSVHHLSGGGFVHMDTSRGRNKRNLEPKKQSFKKPCNHNPNSKPKRVSPFLVCREIGHYVSECKDRKSVRTTHVVKQGLVYADKFNKGRFKMELEKGKIVITKGKMLKSKINLKVTLKFYTRIEAGNISTNSLTHFAKRMASNTKELYPILLNIMVFYKERIEPFVRWSIAC